MKNRSMNGYYVSLSSADIPGFHRIDTEISVYLGIKNGEIWVGLDQYDERVNDLDLLNLEFLTRIKNSVPIPPDSSPDKPTTVPIYVYWEPEPYPDSFVRIKTIDSNVMVKVWEVDGDKIVTYDQEISRSEWPEAHLCILDCI